MTRPMVSLVAAHRQPPLVGCSDAIRALDRDVECAARSDAKVLITGETGVGKEVVARLIHQRSGRASAALVTLNCAGLPDSLLESELFGHVRGSFTGAYRDKPGLLEMSPNGSIFLDEVGEMSSRMQAVLLRFLESGEIQRVGADRARAIVNVRLITATNRDLQASIAAGLFREDLYFRLNVIRLSIPPLRERPEDIPPLVQHFLLAYRQEHAVRASDVAPAAMAALVRYRWPGNVRELKNVVERMVLKATGPTVQLSDIPAEVLRADARLQAAHPENGHGALTRPDEARELATRLLEQGESFWSAVYPQFIARDLTRAELRRIVQIGLERSGGSYRMLVRLFNMRPEDYKRFLSFLNKHDCHLPFRRFRALPARLDGQRYHAVVTGKLEPGSG